MVIVINVAIAVIDPDQRVTGQHDADQHRQRRRRHQHLPHACLRDTDSI